MHHYILTNKKCQITQEQSIASKIVQVVFAGNLVEIPQRLLNGQVFTFLYRVREIGKQKDFREKSLFLHIPFTAYMSFTV